MVEHQRREYNCSVMIYYQQQRIDAFGGDGYFCTDADAVVVSATMTTTLVGVVGRIRLHNKEPSVVEQHLRDD